MLVCRLPQSLFRAGLSSRVAGVRCNLAQMVGRLGELLIGQGTARDLNNDPIKGILVEVTDYLIKVRTYTLLTLSLIPLFLSNTSLVIHFINTFSHTVVP